MHETCPIQFTLVVDDFAIRYTDKKDADHLMSALRDHYQHRGLDGNSVLRHYTGLGLHSPDSGLIHARLH